MKQIFELICELEKFPQFWVNLKKRFFSFLNGFFTPLSNKLEEKSGWHFEQIFSAQSIHYFFAFNVIEKRDLGSECLLVCVEALKGSKERRSSDGKNPSRITCQCIVSQWHFRKLTRPSISWVMRLKKVRRRISKLTFHLLRGPENFPRCCSWLHFHNNICSNVLFCHFIAKFGTFVCRRWVADAKKFRMGCFVHPLNEKST